MKVFGGRVRRAHSAIVRSATELLLGAHQLSGVRRRRRDNALSPPARPQSCPLAALAPSNRARSSVAPPVVVARAPPSGRRPRSYTRRARVGAVRMCVSERARTQYNVRVDVRRARRGSLMRLSLLRLRRLHIYKRINTPYAPDLNPPLSSIAVRIRFSHPTACRLAAVIAPFSLASHHRRTPFSPETTFQPLGIVYIYIYIMCYNILYISQSASQPHVIKDIG